MSEIWMDAITSDNDATYFLDTFYKHDSILLHLNSNIYKWITNDWTNIEYMENNVNTQIQNIYEELSLHHNDEFNKKLKISLECLVLRKLHDSIMSNLYISFKSEDNLFFEKCKELGEITAEQFGAPKEFAIQLSAAVVELANLDACKTVLSKLNCLCTTYDLIFAELKSEIVEIIAKSSKENDIPIIENWAVIPILMTVLIRSKLVHVISNFYYIEAFTSVLIEDAHIRFIMKIYQNAINNIYEITKSTLQPSCNEICKDLNLYKLMKLSSDCVSEEETSEDLALLKNQTTKLKNLITASVEDS